MKRLWFHALIPLLGCAAATPAPVPSGTVTGQVALSGKSDNSGATVVVVGASATATTDSAGAFTITGVPVGTRTLLAFAAGYAPGTESNLQVTAGATTTAPTLELAALPAGATVDAGPGPGDAGPGPGDAGPGPGDAGPGPEDAGPHDGGVQTPADAGPFQATPALSGTATLLNATDWSGTTVSVAGTDLSTTTAADGTWAIPNTPSGFVTLRFSNGEYQATLPNVLSLAGSQGTIVDGTTWALVPMDVPRGQFLTPGTLFSSVTSNPNWALTQYPDSHTDLPVIAVVSTATGASFELEPGVGNAWLSLDGRNVVYTLAQPSSVLKSIPTGGGPPVTLSTEVAPGHDIDLAGNTVLYFVANGSSFDVRTRPITGGAETTLITVSAGLANEDLLGQWGVFSSDFTEIALCTSSGLFVTPLNTPAGAPLVSACETPRFTPDGRTVFYGKPGNSGTSYFALATTGSASPVPVCAANPVQNFYGLLPDGSAAIFDQSPNYDFVFCPLNGGSAVVTAFNPYGLTITSDSAYALYDLNGLLYRASTATGQSTLLYTPPPVGEDPAVFLTPDAQTVVVLTKNTLVAIDVPTATVTPLSQLASGSALIAFSPDGTRVAFTESRPGAAGLDMAVVPLSGATAAVPQIYEFGVNDALFWVDNSTLVVQRTSTPAPYAALNGVYKVPVSP